MNYYVGHTKNFIKVFINKNDNKEELNDKIINEIYKVRLIEIKEEGMIGEILWED